MSKSRSASYPLLLSIWRTIESALPFKSEHRMAYSCADLTAVPGGSEAERTTSRDKFASMTAMSFSKR